MIIVYFQNIQGEIYDDLLVTVVLIMFLAMISYNIITGDTLSKVFQRIPGGTSIYLFCIVIYIIIIIWK